MAKGFTGAGWSGDFCSSTQVSAHRSTDLESSGGMQEIRSILRFIFDIYMMMKDVEDFMSTGAAGVCQVSFLKRTTTKKEFEREVTANIRNN